MNHFERIKWLDLYGNPVGRIKLENGLWITIVKQADSYTCQPQISYAREVFKRDEYEVDKWLDNVSKIDMKGVV